MNKSIVLQKDSLCFTYCQIPIIYKNTNEQSIKIFFTEGRVEKLNDLTLGKNISKLIFERTGKVDRIEVSVIK